MRLNVKHSGASVAFTRYCVEAFNLGAFMAGFSFASPDKARAAIYDAAMLILTADAQVALPIDSQTIRDLGELCRRVEAGEKLSSSPLLQL